MINVNSMNGKQVSQSISYRIELACKNTNCQTHFNNWVNEDIRQEVATAMKHITERKENQ